MASPRQLAYYWGVLLPAICDELGIKKEHAKNNQRWKEKEICQKNLAEPTSGESHSIYPPPV